jgi:NAD-dependent DNA ligase (contains BRCT domain type II)
VNLGSLRRWRELDVIAGDQVIVTLAGQGIPRLERVIWRVRGRDYPLTPQQGVFNPLSCLHFNQDCRLQFLSRLTWLSQKSVLNIPGVQRSSWQRLLNSGAITHLFSWLTLTPEEIAQDSGMSSARAQEIWQRFQQTRQQPFRRWVSALGLPLPRTALQALADNDWTALLARSADEWQQLPGIGRTLAERIVSMLQDEELQQLIRFLQQQEIPAAPLMFGVGIVEDRQTKAEAQR